MSFGRPLPPVPTNEPIRSYAPGTPERASLRRRLEELAANPVEIPLVIGGEEIRTGDVAEIRAPHDHSLVLGRYHKAKAEHVQKAIAAAMAARHEWMRTPWEDRAAILLRAAELLAGEMRDTLNAATMLGQSKTSHQAEIDSACELVDFWRFNPHSMAEIYAQQPINAPGTWNRVEYRPLDGFVFAVTPFNFTSIAGNLPTAPALMGNTVVWKPASSSVYSNWFVLQILRKAGMPAGVINFVPGSGSQVGDPVMASEHLGGVHFTGSMEVWNGLWRQAGEGLGTYRCYPRLVGETGGKDFVVAHSSADPEALAVALLRGAFEFQGQKCSAASRAYVPESLWKGSVRDHLAAMVGEMRVGDPADFGNFMGAVIDRGAFDRIAGYQKHARESSGIEVITGGNADDSKGFFVEPTVVQVSDPRDRLMAEEIFGPVLSVYVYPDAKFAEALHLCDTTSPFGLTGAIFADDRQAVQQAFEALRFAAGNFYINDKPTGAVVGQQPFGGSRMSGTNDKAGSAMNLMRWTSARTIKENFAPPKDWRYPFLSSDEPSRPMASVSADRP